MSETPKVRARTAWTASAKRAFRDVADANPTMEKAKLSALYSACDLLSEADKMQERVDADGLVVTGSQGQPVAHPLVAEIRQYRRAALETLKALAVDGRGGSSSAGAALANKRWSSRPAGNVTSITRAAAPGF